MKDEKHPAAVTFPSDGNSVAGRVDGVEESSSIFGSSTFRSLIFGSSTFGYGSAKLPTIRENVITARNFMVTLVEN